MIKIVIVICKFIRKENEPSVSQMWLSVSRKSLDNQSKCKSRSNSFCSNVLNVLIVN